MTFKELFLNDKILKSLEKNNFTEPTEIQQKAIPVFLEGKNLFGKSSTGTGKTASFALPILQKINIKFRKPQAIIMAPTRELALQIVDSIRMFSSMMEGISVAPLIGGMNMNDQIRRVKDSQIVVGTPGRINDHINRKTLKLDAVEIIVLDEADEMLKLGFKNEIDAVFNNVVPTTQIGLYSATMNTKVMKIASDYMGAYELIEIDNQIKVNNNISNVFVLTKGYAKEDVLIKLMEVYQPQRTIVFTNTRSNTTKIHKTLVNNNIKAEIINGDKQQSQRTRTIKKFKNGEFKVLVATDVVARGIDIDGIDLVINFDISIDDEYFIHRIGRTGRNNATGQSITLVNSRNLMSQLEGIKKQYSLIIDELDISNYDLPTADVKKQFGQERTRNASGSNFNSRSRSGFGNSSRNGSGSSSRSNSGSNSRNSFGSSSRNSSESSSRNDFGSTSTTRSRPNGKWNSTSESKDYGTKSYGQGSRNSNDQKRSDRYTNTNDQSFGSSNGGETFRTKRHKSNEVNPQYGTRTEFGHQKTNNRKRYK